MIQYNTTKDQFVNFQVFEFVMEKHISLRKQVTFQKMLKIKFSIKNINQKIDQPNSNCHLIF